MLHGHLLVQEHQLHFTTNLQIVVCLLFLTALVSVVVVDAGQQLHNLNKNIIIIVLLTN